MTKRGKIIPAWCIFHLELENQISWKGLPEMASPIFFWSWAWCTVRSGSSEPSSVKVCKPLSTEIPVSGWPASACNHAPWETSFLINDHISPFWKLWLLFFTLWLGISEESQVLGFLSILYIWWYLSTLIFFPPLPLLTHDFMSSLNFQQQPTMFLFPCWKRNSLPCLSLHTIFLSTFFRASFSSQELSVQSKKPKNKIKNMNCHLVPKPYHCVLSSPCSPYPGLSLPLV